jgi:hypothetical protein
MGYSVNEGATTSIPVTGGGPAYEWDTDCDGLTPARGDLVGPSPFTFTAHERDGASVARICVRSFNPTCPAATRFSAQVVQQVAVRNVAPTITTNALPVAITGRPYSFRFNANDPANPPFASMTRDPLVWSAMGLPAGWSIDPMTGTLTGMSAAAGVISFTIFVNDGDGGMVGRDYRLTIVAPTMAVVPACPALTINGSVGGALAMDEGSTLNVTATVGTPVPMGCTCRPAWDIGCDGDVDVIDGGATLSAVGLDGPSGFRVCATSVATAGACVSSNGAAVASVTVRNVAPTITTMALPSGTVGTAYVTQALSTDPANPPNAGGIQDPQTWSAMGLPAGLAIDPATGIISGTPTMMGTFTVTITVNDGDGGTSSRMLTLTINGVMSNVCPSPMLIAPGPIAPAVDEGGSVMLSATLGGSTCGCAVEWDVDCDGTREGSGTTFTLSGVDRDGASMLRLCLRGVPSLVGTCTMPSPTSGNTVNVRNVAPTITNMGLPTGTLGVAYMATLTASDPANPPVASMVRDPIAWSATGLPPGLGLNAMTGVISGTPTTAAGAMARCYPVVITANDGDGGITMRTIDLCLVATPPMVCPAPRPLADGPFTAPEGAVATIAVAFGGAGACGCTVDWDTNCDGTSDAAGLTATFDARGLDGPTTRAACWIARPTAMGPCNAASPAQRNQVNVTNVAPTITTASLADASPGVMYSATIAATDPANPPIGMTVQDPFTWSLMGAPAWLSIDASTGALTGTPPASAAGMSFTFTVIVTDGDGGRTTRMYTLRVLPAAMSDAGTDAMVGTDATVDTDAMVGADAMVSTDAMVDTDATVDTDAMVSADATVETDATVDTDAMVSADASIDPDSATTGDAQIVGDGASADSGARPDGATVSDGGFGLSGDGACACRAAGHGRAPSSRVALVAMGLVLATALSSRRRARR